MSGQTMLIALSVGLIAGWLGNVVAPSTGLGLAGSLTMGIFGAILGALLVPVTGLDLGNTLAGILCNAVIGAALGLLLIELVRPEDRHA